MFLGLSPPYPIDCALKTLKKGRAAESVRVLAAIGWPWNHQPILLAGSPRTGTSWTAKMLSMARNMRYVREPVSHGGFEAGVQGIGYRYLLAGDEDPEYDAIWRAALSRVTMISQRWLLAETQPLLRRVPFWPARLLVKEVNCPLALDWLAENFKMKVVVTLRHPCGYVASGLRVQREGDPFVSLDQLLNQPRLVADYFVDDYDWLSQLKDPIARMAAWYGMVYKVLADQLSRHPEWVLVRHEAFCEDPLTQFRRLFEALGIRYTTRVQEYLRLTSQQSDGNLYSVYRKTAAEPNKWKRELTTKQIDTIAEVIARFRLPFYREFA
jgi:hypothetical protein